MALYATPRFSVDNKCVALEEGKRNLISLLLLLRCMYVKWASRAAFVVVERVFSRQKFKAHGKSQRGGWNRSAAGMVGRPVDRAWHIPTQMQLDSVAKSDLLLWWRRYCAHPFRWVNKMAVWLWGIFEHRESYSLTHIKLIVPIICTVFIVAVQRGK